MSEEELMSGAPERVRRRKKKRPAGSLSDADRMAAKEGVEEILHMAVDKGVSDTHLIADLEPMFRLHGGLIPAYDRKLKNRDTTAFAEALCTEEQWKHFLSVGEVDLAYELKGKGRFRVNIFRQKGNTSIALRQIPTSIPKIDKLGVPPTLKQMIHKHQGLFLVTGPTGSGKSTTLASMLDYLNDTKKAHILTLEDPIEYIHNHRQCIISQREIGRDTESFGNGLRAALRQDPDVILVGEMRDFETISIALTAAETGHLVLGTLHTSSAPATIERIVDVFPPEQQSQILTQLSGALQGIVSQRLLPTWDGNGRVAATELLVNTNSIANLIRSGKTHQISNMMQMGKSEGMQTMEACIQELIQEGKVDVDAAEALLGESGE